MCVQPQAHRVNSGLWRACAGPAVQLPKLNSVVYYFPEGHVEHSSLPPETLSPLRRSKQGVILCLVTGVEHLADQSTDEVFAKILLHPINGHNWNSVVLNNAPDVDANEENSIQSHAKVLTLSDANNGGGFSVPKQCADSILPQLDLSVERPAQNLSMRDLHGVEWRFRHIFRGRPKRHLFTTGWTPFVNAKVLIAGDTVVFMKKTNGDMFVGIRKTSRPFVNVKESDESAVTAIDLAAKGSPFEIVYYPKAMRSDFVVKAEVVNEAMKFRWHPGVRVRIAVETENWLEGTVEALCFWDNETQLNSPWRMLQVRWQGNEDLQHPPRVNPWQVEVIYPMPIPLPPSTFPPAIKSRVSPSYQAFSTTAVGVFSPMSSVNHPNPILPTMALSNPTPPYNRTSSPAGMQEARQNPFHLSSLANWMNESTPNMLSNCLRHENINSTDMSAQLKNGNSKSNDSSTISKSSESDERGALSTHGQTELGVGSSRLSDETAQEKQDNCSIRLFGKIIHVKQNDQRPSDDA